MIIGFKNTKMNVEVNSFIKRMKKNLNKIKK